VRLFLPQDLLFNLPVRALLVSLLFCVLFLLNNADELEEDLDLDLDLDLSL
jgi:hypothetical protein